MENPDIRYFYRNIVKSGDKYRIKHHNKDYGEFKKLSDALYERDCLFYCKETACFIANLITTFLWNATFQINMKTWTFRRFQKKGLAEKSRA